LLSATAPRSPEVGSTNALIVVFLSDGSSTPDGRPIPGDAVLLGYDDGANQITVNARTTATALVLLNPLLVRLDASQRRSFIAAAQAHPDFDDLVTVIATRVGNSPSQVVRDDVIEQAVRICLDVLESGAQSQITAKGAASEKDIHSADEFFRDLPFVRDAPGNQMVFVNPRLAHYAGNLYTTGQNAPIKSVYMDARGGLLVDFSFTWTWPPSISVFASNAETNLGVLQDGAYTARFSKAWSFDRITRSCGT